MVLRVPNSTPPSSVPSAHITAPSASAPALTPTPVTGVKRGRRPRNPGLTDEQRKLERSIKNRESAKRSRLREKERERKVADQLLLKEKDRDSLRSEVEVLRIRCQKLEATLRTQISTPPSLVTSHPNSPPLQDRPDIKHTAIDDDAMRASVISAGSQGSTQDTVPPPTSPPHQMAPDFNATKPNNPHHAWTMYPASVPSFPPNQAHHPQQIQHSYPMLHPYPHQNQQHFLHPQDSAKQPTRPTAQPAMFMAANGSTRALSMYFIV